MVGQKGTPLIGRLIYFIVVVIIACLLAWAATEIVGAFDFIPAAIKRVVYVVAWVIAVIVILWTAYRLFAGSIPSGPNPPA